MAREWTPADLDDLVQRYLAGAGIAALAAAFGCRKSAVREVLATRSVTQRTFSEVQRINWLERTDHFPLADAELIRRYVENGESTVMIGRTIDRSPSAVGARLRRLGVERTAAEAQRARNHRMTDAERMAQTAAAHAASRGSRRDQATLEAAALARQRRKGATIGHGEVLLVGWLRERGLDPIPQLAVDRYNVDIGLLPVTVEVVFRTAADVRKPAFVRKIEHLTNRGLHVLIVLMTRRLLIQEATADDVVAFLEQAKADPSPVGQYRVIWGSGQFLAGGRGDFNQWAAIPPPRNGKGPRG